LPTESLWFHFAWVNVFQQSSPSVIRTTERKLRGVGTLQKSSLTATVKPFKAKVLYLTGYGDDNEGDDNNDDDDNNNNNVL